MQPPILWILTLVEKTVMPQTSDILFRRSNIVEHAEDDVEVEGLAM